MHKLSRLEIALALLAFFLFITLLDAIEIIMEMQAGLPTAIDPVKVTVIDGDCSTVDSEQK